MCAQFQLGDWVVEPALNQLLRNGQPVRLEPKVMQVLVCLAEAGEVVPKEKLMRTVWPDTYVTDDVLTRSISELRKAFNDDSKHPRFIQTIPKRGYRLLLPALPVEATNGNRQNLENQDKVQQAPALSPPSRWPRARVWALVLVVVAIAGLTLFLAATHKKVVLLSELPRQPAAGGKVTLAVLPFQNLSSDHDGELLADGLTAEMISQMGRLSSDKINVIAWNSMVKYKGMKKSDDSLASELGANYVLEGTVQRWSNRVRITAELVRVGERSHLWANSYDGDLDDVLNLQSRLAREIAGDIRLSLTPEEERLLAAKTNLHAAGYEAYLRGQLLMFINTGPEGVQSSMALVKKAIALNPDYAPGYVALANFYRGLTNFGWAPPRKTYPKMRAALDTAIEKQPDNPEALHLLGWLAWRFDWNFPAAEADFKKAIQMRPSDAGAHLEYGLFLKSMGRYGEALQESRQGVELSPLESVARTNLAALLALAGQTGTAMEQFRSIEQSDPNLAYVHERMAQALLWQQNYRDALHESELACRLSHDQPEKLAWLAYALAKSGDRAEALKLVRRLKHLPRQRYLSPFHMSLPYIALDDRDAAMQWLEKAYRDRDEWLVYLKVYPEFDPLRSDSRFRSLVRRVGLE
jgi:TolB-like protein/DNA-binding winged helix-turn-helix (wHTH) protein/Tfp pilus assembly protein PilF